MMKMFKGVSQGGEGRDDDDDDDDGDGDGDGAVRPRGG